MHLLLVASLFLVVMPGAPFVVPLLLVAMPFAPSSFLLFLSYISFPKSLATRRGLLQSLGERAQRIKTLQDVDQPMRDFICTTGGNRV